MLPLKILQLFICYPMGIEISFNAKIGRGLYIGHMGSIVVHPDATIGEFCNLSQEVTIGFGGRGNEAGVPTIGNKVYIGPGAKVFGRIKVGDNVAIGANSVVSGDVQTKAVVGGVPAKILNYKSSDAFIQNCSDVHFSTSPTPPEDS
jgi:serine O-acetyltransferase